jgi:hypothetical protein
LKIQIKIVLLVVFISSALSLICSLHNGIGLTDDSGSYVYGAYSFFNEGIVMNHFGKPLVVYPPLYPTLLSFAYFTGINIFLFASIINSMALGLIVWISHLFLEKIFTENKFYYITLFWVAFSTLLFMDSVFLWSDIIFIFFTFASFWFFLKFTEENSYYFLLLSVLFGIFSFYQRIIGLNTFIVEGIYLLVFYDRTIKEKIKPLLIISSLSLIAFFILIARNKILNGNVIQGYSPAVKGIFTNAISAADILSSFILPGTIPLWIRIGFIVSAVLIGLYFRKGTGFVKNKYLQLIITFLIVYTVMFIFLESYYCNCEYDDRTFSPVYICVVLLFIKSVESVYEKKQLKLVIWSLIGLSFFPAIRFVKNFRQWYTIGAGYHSKTWKEEPAILWLKNNLVGEKIFSDNPIALNLLCRPEFNIPPANPKEAYQYEHFYFVKWNEKIELHYAEVNYTLYREKFNFELVKSFENCTVYLLTKK